MMIRKAAVIYNDKKAEAAVIAARVRELLAAEKVIFSEGSIDPDTELLISIGGDGTLLRTARLLHDLDIPIAHINVGTLGFLGYAPADAAEYVKKLLYADFAVEERLMIEASTGNTTFRALNDIVIKNGDTARMISIELFIDDKKVYSINGDGVIISTPTGSTAYSLASGGPVVEPGLGIIVITPLSPHTLSTRPLIVGDINIKIVSTRDDDKIVLTADGQITHMIESADKINISAAPQKLKLVKSEEDFFSLLSRKLGWG
ncbi:MAG: NAD(+)/NADH kinase [Elusimicrobiota bacterium]